VRIDAELWHTSWCVLKHGQEHELGSTHQFRASLVFTAFALEAYLNHIGPLHFKSWGVIERKLTPIEKLIILCEQLKIDIDWSARPWQSVKALIRYRNTIAHGRGEELFEDYTDSIDHYELKLYESPLTEWEKYASAETAVRAREDVEFVAHALHDKGGDLQDYPFFPGSQSGTAGPPRNV